MRKFALVLGTLVLLTAGLAQAGSMSIHTLQVNSPAAVNSLVTPGSQFPAGSPSPTGTVVTAVRSTGFFVSQAPHGAWDAIWVSFPNPVYFSGQPVLPGHLVDICGLFREVCGLTTIDIVAAGIYGWVTKTGTAAVPAPNFVTAAAFAANPEQWESVTVTIIDGMQVPAGFSLGSGQWTVQALDGTMLVFDDFWYDFGSVAAGQCYNNATGILHDGCGTYMFEPFAGGIPIVSCTVAEESVSMGTIKALFR